MLPRKIHLQSIIHLINLHANKHSNSKYPEITKEETRLLESMVKYDNKHIKL